MTQRQQLRRISNLQYPTKEDILLYHVRHGLSREEAQALADEYQEIK